MRMKALACVGMLSALLTCADATAGATVDAATYARAERFLAWNRDKLVFGDGLDHRWIGDADALWYKRAFEGGWEFVVVEPALRHKRPAFEHRRMALALSKSLGRTLSPEHLPISDLDFAHGIRSTPRVIVDGKTFDCELRRLECRAVPTPPRDAARAYSPNGEYAVFAKGANLWMGNLATGEERALTTDGEDHQAYGAVPESSGMAVTDRRRKVVRPPMGTF